MTTRVRVPATSANLGAGFDCVGVAVDRWLTASVTLTGDAAVIHRHGTLAALQVPVEEDLLTHGFRAACAGRAPSPRGFTIDATSDIPVGFGLGSSAAALVAGALLADAAYGLGLTREQIVDVAAAIEGHADNVAPAVFGGAVLAVRGPAGFVCAPLTVAPGLDLVIAVPPFPSDTKAARAALPRSLSHANAVLAAGRAAALVQGLATADGALLAAALDDVLHVPFRKAGIPGYDAVVVAARAAGAYGATLSGAGSALLAIAPSECARAVGDSMGAAWRAAGVEAQVIRCPRPVGGATVSRIPTPTYQT